MNTRIDTMDGRLHETELYIQAQQMYEKALKRVYNDKQRQDSSSEISARTQTWINLGKLIGLLTIAVGAYLAGKGLQ